ncbi:bifunctional folylpolyglutamate synthase/dihydrofolate synthase [Nibricoccus sp. IMCC34717]|uniref:bifunctional folylpolyglutamate synthase/dihydrofolate synthase n=1 Tax=Nibricoccus sp. IMCC34717 TaxID=3034021 RepID=UPI00384FDE02
MPDRFPNYAAVQDYLFGLKARGVRYGIDRMRLWTGALGHPELAVPCIHIAGTNGKGSVCAMVESLLRATGARVGLYTSPHLRRLGERIQVDRRVLGETAIHRYTEQLADVAQTVSRECPDDHPSFFEFMTAMAFLHFRQERCDWNVIEVGMGGRLDATNVVQPAVTAITSIGLDHCEFLGNTLAEIAREKAGILKAGVPVVLGWLPPEAEHEIRLIAAQRGCRVISVREEFGEDLARYPETALAGDMQRVNAATATLVVRELGGRVSLSDEERRRALRSVAWAGRWETRQVDGRTLVLDSSHNPEGAAVLEANLAELARTDNRRPVVVTGVLGAARARPLLAVIAKHARRIHLVVPRQARACGFTELKALMPPDCAVEVVESEVAQLFPAEGRCDAGTPGDLVVVTGSIYLLGEVLTQLEGTGAAYEGRLQDF